MGCYIIWPGCTFPNDRVEHVIVDAADESQRQSTLIFRSVFVFIKPSLFLKFTLVQAISQLDFLLCHYSYFVRLRNLNTYLDGMIFGLMRAKKHKGPF